MDLSLYSTPSHLRDAFCPLLQISSRPYPLLRIEKECNFHKGSWLSGFNDLQTRGLSSLYLLRCHSPMPDFRPQQPAQNTLSKFSWALRTQPTNSNGSPLCPLSWQPLCPPPILQVAVIILVGLRSKVASSRKLYLTTPCVRAFLTPDHCPLSQCPIVVIHGPDHVFKMTFLIYLLIDTCPLHWNKARWDQYLVLLPAASLEARTRACT